MAYFDTKKCSFCHVILQIITSIYFYCYHRPEGSHPSFLQYQPTFHPYKQKCYNNSPPCPLLPGGEGHILPLPPEDVLPVYLVLLSDSAVYLVPQLNIKAKVDMKVLVVVVVENTIRLPRLEPQLL